MKVFHVTATIDTPCERVWEVMADVDRWHEWTPTIRRIDRRGDAPLAVGDVAWIRQPRLPPARWRVTALQPGRGFTWVSTAPGLRVVAEHKVEPAGTGSVATLTLEHHGPMGWLLRWLTRSITARYLDLEVRGLKSRSEDPGYRWADASSGGA